MTQPVRVLFVCEKNAYPCQLAGDMLRSMGGDGVEVTCASAERASQDVLATRVLREAGIGGSDAGCEPLDALPRGTFDLVVSLGAELPNLRTLNIGAPVRLHWSLQRVAPSAKPSVETIRAIRDELAGHLHGLVEDGYLEAMNVQRTRMENLADLMDEGMVAHDEFRRIYVFNRSAEAATGIKREDVLGRDCHDVFAPHGLCGNQCAFVDGPPTNLGERSYTIPFTTPEGVTRQLKVSSRPILSPEGEQRDVLAVIHDSTEVNELRYQLGRYKSFHGMVGGSRAVREVFDTIRQVAPSDYPVLITGESGTGKELAANAIHRESHRKDGPFVPVNCGALPENILESEIFGHVRGAFTGAIRAKKGRFELADRGTLFLDEVGELSPAFQVKLLRVLQEQRFERVGGERPVHVDVRIIAATNRDLRRMIAEGSFREDLFYRLCVVPIELPPLRNRKEDFPLLVEHLLETVREQTGKTIRGVADEVMDDLMRHRWPGNIRELINTLQFASVRCDGDVIQPQHLPLELRQAVDGEAALASPAPIAAAAPPPEDSRSSGGRRPKLHLASVQDALAATGGNKVKAAKRLGVGRATLYRFLKENPL